MLLETPFLPAGDDIPELRDADFLAQVGVWPPKRQMDPSPWLRNFTADEKPYAEDLLRSFMYFSAELCEELLRSAVQRLSQHVLDFDREAKAVSSAWRDFVGGLYVLPVRGERPNSTDSGFSYVRTARIVFGLDEENQFPSEVDALRQLLRDASGGVRHDVVFVDDFVGSGTQFIRTWTRSIDLGNGQTSSFAKVARSGVHRFFFCPLIATTQGASRIAKRCPAVRLSPAHFVPEEYSALHPNSRVWSEERRASGPDMLAAIAARAGMPASGGTDDWRGVKELALSLAIHDSIPDATLGVFRWNRNGWVPLLKTPASL